MGNVQNKRKGPSHNKKAHFSNKKKDTKIAKGVISVNSKGIGYIEIEGFQDDIEIAGDKLNTAFHGDEVEVKVLPKDKRFRRIQGEVVRVIKRAKDTFVGVIEKVGNQTGLIADNKRMFKYITLTDDVAAKTEAGKKALVKITSWENKQTGGPQGIIIKVIGDKGEHNAEMKSILMEKGFDPEFPPEVEAEAENILSQEKNRWNQNLAGRKDFRNTWTCTIDPADAKDFDDAISLKKLDNGEFEIGVHIADVSHYVREGSILDKEAQKRAFSVYLVDRTIPMLPEILSNDLCSLNPNEDKLSYSSVFTMTKEGRITSRWFGKTAMRSIKRFSYEEAQAVLDKGSGEFFEQLNTLNLIAKKLRKEKYAAGAIDFEKDEVKFELDNLGKPIRVFKKERLDTHKLVEEYMLLANKEVASFIAKAHKTKVPQGTFIYRVHGEPDQEKMRDLSIFLKALGFNFETKGKKITSKDISKMLDQVTGSPQESLIKTAAIRSMAKAIYSTQNIGHFGLAFDYYTHFTSPIRRYPDLLVHRLLESHLKGGKIEPDAFAKYQKIAIHSSEKEVAAAEAERGSIKYKQVEYMKEHIGEAFTGTISGVTEWGIYVEEDETKCEGMIRIRDLGEDYFILNEKQYAIVGERTKKRFSLGDKIKFKVTNADLDRKTLDYLPA